MTIIDSQVHAYAANTPQRPWHSVPNWPAHVTGDEMVAAMDTVGVDGAIVISAFSLYQASPKNRSNFVRQAVSPLPIVGCEAKQKTLVECELPAERHKHAKRREKLPIMPSHSTMSHQSVRIRGE
jgi:hypothetical protein